MKLYDVIKRIIGIIEPYGDSVIDDGRKESLNTHIDITNNLIKDLILVSEYRNRNEFSINNIGNLAYYELVELKQLIDNALEK